jgi:hypothetical protein
VIATELLEFGGIPDESFFEEDLTNSKDEDKINTNHISSEAENIKEDDQVSFTPAGSQFGEIGERIRSAKAGSRVKHKPDNPIIMPLNNHV